MALLTRMKCPHGKYPVYLVSSKSLESLLAELLVTIGGAIIATASPHHTICFFIHVPFPQKMHHSRQFLFWSFGSGIKGLRFVMQLLWALDANLEGDSYETTALYAGSLFTIFTKLLLHHEYPTTLFHLTIALGNQHSPSWREGVSKEEKG